MRGRDRNEQERMGGGGMFRGQEMNEMKRIFGREGEMGGGGGFRRIKRGMNTQVIVSHPPTHLSDGLIGMPRSPVLSILLFSSIFKCTKNITNQTTLHHY